MKAKNSSGLAVGAYLRVLREHAGISKAHMARLLDIDISRISRLEDWRNEPHASTLFAYIRLVGGDCRDVARLINDSTNGKAEGEAAARMRIKELAG